MLFHTLHVQAGKESGLTQVVNLLVVVMAGGTMWCVMVQCVIDKFNNKQTKVYELLFLSYRVPAMHSLQCLSYCCRVEGEVK